MFLVEMDLYLFYKIRAEDDMWGRSMRELFRGDILRMWEIYINKKLKLEDKYSFYIINIKDRSLRIESRDTTR